MSAFQSFLYTSPYYEFIDERDYLVLRRTRLDIENLEAMRGEYEELISAFPPHGTGLLFDARAARPRNDPAFEEISKTLRVRVVETFERVALMVETVAGSMQISRLMHAEDVRNARAFYDYDEAIEWLCEAAQSNAAPS